MSDRNLDIDIGRSQLGTGVLAGVAAYVVGFLAMFLPGPIANPAAYPPRDVLNATITRNNTPEGIDPTGEEFPLTETADGFSSAGGVFYNAHFVDITFLDSRGFGSGVAVRSNVLLAEHVNGTTGLEALSGGELDIGLAGLPIPPLVLFALPVLLLALGGYLINRRTNEALPTPETAVASGSAVALGYLPLVAIGAAMIRFRTQAVIFGGIDILGAIVIAGIVYPVTFGGLGGYAWHVVRRRRNADRGARTATPEGSGRSESAAASGRAPPASGGAPAGSAAGPERGQARTPGTERGARGSTGGSQPGGGAPGTDRTNEPPATATTKRVTMTDGLAFEPETITITAGDTVRWENEGSLTFTVTAYEDTIPRGVGYFASGGFRSEEVAREAYPEGGIESGESYSHTFETPGVYEYFCVPQENAGMVGTVEVRER